MPVAPALRSDLPWSARRASAGPSGVAGVECRLGEGSWTVEKTARAYKLQAVDRLGNRQGGRTKATLVVK